MIKFDRRSFFAALAAPFVARFLPKPKATGGLFNPHGNVAAQYERDFGVVWGAKDDLRRVLNTFAPQLGENQGKQRINRLNV